MKTRYFMMLSVLLTLTGAGSLMAQSPCTPTLTSVNGSSGLVNFSAATPNPVNGGDIFYWNYGDGTSGIGSIASDAHTYLSDGVYYTSVTYSTNVPSSCSGIAADTVTITNAGCNLIANLTVAGSPTNSSISFNNTSTGWSGISTATVDMGDGSAPAIGLVSNLLSGYYTYTTNGTYVITLTEDNNTLLSCTSTKTVQVTINPQSCTPTFSYVLGAAGSVTFTGTAPGTGVFNWTFDNFFVSGANTSAPQTYTFPSDGQYLVDLLYVGNSNTCTALAVQTVTITNAGCNLFTNFSSVPNSSVTIFSNSSTGSSNITTATWDYGDNSTPFVETPPSLNTHMYSYANAGTYLVTLTENNNVTPACISSKTLLVNVPYGPPCVSNANFTIAPSGTPLIWNAAPVSAANVVSAEWNWGDGSVSNTLYTSHTYSAAAAYNICLSVTVTCGDTSTSCMNYSIYRTSSTAQNMNMIRVDVINQLAPVGIKTSALENVDYSISPNPNDGLFDLKLSGLSQGNVNIVIYNLLGKQVYETSGETLNGSFVKEIQLDNVANGVYFIKANANGTKLFTKKMIVNN